MNRHDLQLDAEFAVRFVHRLRFTRGVFNSANRTLADVIVQPTSQPARAVVFVDHSIAQHQQTLNDQLQTYVASHSAAIKLVAPTQIVPGGETCKNNPRLLEPILQCLSDAQLDRQSYVIVIGGGAVLDAVGFAAAMVHRGVRLIRIPTTTLAQADSGVGVKNAINGFGKKNFLGSFAPPWAVINDYDLLATLAPRDWVCGFVEAVKVGLIKDRGLFDLVAGNCDLIRRCDPSICRPVLQRSAQLHMEHIVRGGDPFEMTSARPLDFGHWAAHKLEFLSDFKLRHGEAVSIGIALDTLYAHEIGWLTQEDTQRVLGCLTQLGLPIHHDAMHDIDTLLAGIDEFREHLGGELCITLLRGLGDPVDVHEIDQTKMLRAIHNAQHHARIANRKPQISDQK